MQYDELEEQYYILSQKVKDLELENNQLQNRNTELEATNIVLENKLSREETKNEQLADSVQEESLKAINLKVRIEHLDEEIRKHRDLQTRGFFGGDSVEAQAQRNQQSSGGRTLPKYSIHQPMEPFTFQSGAPTNIVLGVSDVFGFRQEINPHEFGKSFHAYAKMDDKVVRYSQRSMLDLGRPEDFGVVLNQMTDGLKEVIINEWSKSNGFR